MHPVEIGTANLEHIRGQVPVAHPQIGKLTLQDRIVTVGENTVVTFRPSRAIVHSA